MLCSVDDLRHTCSFPKCLKTMNHVHRVLRHIQGDQLSTGVRIKYVNMCNHTLSNFKRPQNFHTKIWAFH